jgi:hypothetical protein
MLAQDKPQSGAVLGMPSTRSPVGADAIKIARSAQT